ncbi:MAG: hypothetical protein VKN33_06980 [Candidatus Sericytochromatia bacterium]|nr:hypothetical protein [Candidatus Sericytochromatia bacterium]
MPAKNGLAERGVDAERWARHHTGMPKPRSKNPASAPSPTPPPPLSAEPALQARIIDAVTTHGEAHREGEVTTWLYNGDTLSIKYVAAGPTQPLRLMVAAFRQGVVFQIEGEQQQVLKRGEWVEGLPS